MKIRRRDVSGYWPDSKFYCEKNSVDDHPLFVQKNDPCLKIRLNLLNPTLPLRVFDSKLFHNQY